jgi:hypothetical protein
MCAVGLRCLAFNDGELRTSELRMRFAAQNGEYMELNAPAHNGTLRGVRRSAATLQNNKRPMHDRAASSARVAAMPVGQGHDQCRASDKATTSLERRRE